MSENPSDSNGVSRRWLLRAMVGLGFGVPLTVEAATVVGLFRSRLSGRESGSGADTAASTPAEEAVGVGDELVPGTPATERVVGATVRAAGESWPFELVVAVENEGTTPYELRFGTVTTDGGTTVEGGASTGRLAHGESTELAATWPLPPGATPAAVAVTALSYDGGGDDPERTERRVPLAKVPVHG